MEPIPDIDPSETQEWLDALESVLTNEGTERAHYLLERLVEKARRSARIFLIAPPPLISIPFRRERKIARPVIMRWSIAFVLMFAGTPWQWCCAPTKIPMLAAISPVLPLPRRSMMSAIITSGMQPRKDHGGDLLFAQGHSSPGLYAYAFLLES